jgi:hypothetical protein
MKMRKLGMTVVLAALAVSALAPMAAAEPLDGRGPGGRAGAWGAAPGQSYTQVALTEAEEALLERAILEEYGALNLYEAVLDQFEDAYPFDRIARAEAQHVRALTRVANRYGVALPENPGLASAPEFDDLADACAAGVTAEKVDGALYDELMAETDNPALTRVFTNLQAASLQSHLPAFQACD